MSNKLNSIRFTYIRSHLYSLFLTTLTLLSILLFIQVLFTPEWLSLQTIFIFITIYMLIGLLISFYIGFKLSSGMKESVDYLSVLITQYANGNYQSRIHFDDNDEISRIGNELNDLGTILQTQVRSLQRMADEKSEYAKSAHKAATIEERQRLARELHDSVSQQLFALTMLSEAAHKQIDRNPALAKEQIQSVVSASHVAQTETRALLLHLRPVYLSGDSLTDGIRKLISELEEKCQIDFQLIVESDLGLSNLIEEHVFRIIQEALSNILRHAKAEKVKVQLKKPDADLLIQINDDGKGFDIKNQTISNTSYGLKTMQERSEEIGGTFNIRSIVDKGTHIDIRIPC